MLKIKRIEFRNAWISEITVRKFRKSKSGSIITVDFDFFQTSLDQNQPGFEKSLNLHMGAYFRLRYQRLLERFKNKPDPSEAAIKTLSDLELGTIRIRKSLVVKDTAKTEEQKAEARATYARRKKRRLSAERRKEYARNRYLRLKAARNENITNQNSTLT